MRCDAPRAMILCFELIHIFTSSHFIFCVSIDFGKPSNWNTAYIGRHELRHSEVPVANVCVRYQNCHLFSCDCCLVFATSLRKSGIYFTGIHTRCSLMHSKAIPQGIERVPRVESSHYCRVGRSFSTCVLHTRGSSLQMSGRSHKSACEEISMEME